MKHPIVEVEDVKRIVIDLGVILLSLFILNIKPSYGVLEENRIHPNILNKDLINYIQTNHIYNIEQICSNHFCSYLKSVNLKKAVEIFEQEYQNFIEDERGKEEALATITKGFPITEILTK